MSRTMNRWSLGAPGRENLALVEAPIPKPGPHDILVRTGAVSLNYRDKLAIDAGFGIGTGFPFTPASDLAGEVVETGAAVRRFKPGDRVISTFVPDWIEGDELSTGRSGRRGPLGGEHQGVLADYVLLDEEWAVRAPAGLDDAAASTLPCAGLTAWFALIEQGRLRAGQTVVTLGTGGVSLFGLQIALAHGAQVIVTSAEDDKLERAKALGATHGINRKAGDWAQAVLALTGGRGADHVLDTVGGANFGRALAATATAGRVSLIGVLEGFDLVGGFGDLARRRLVVQGVGVGHRRALEDLVRAVETARIEPVIDARYPLAELPAALAHLDRGPFGKLVLTA